jgi:regulator of protease activity HflC (stomatin/prohibitin superfamily)
VNSVEDYRDALYLTVQLALRDLVGAAEVDDLLSKRAEIGRTLLEQTAPEIEEFGVKVSSVEIKDIMFPGDLKRMMAQVVQAKKEGQAALERARGETAARRRCHFGRPGSSCRRSNRPRRSSLKSHAAAGSG